MKVQIEIDGVEHHGQYTVDEEIDIIELTALPSWRKSTTILGGHPAEAMAKILLREIVKPYEG